MDTCGLRAPEPEQGDALRLGALTRLRGFVSVLGEELRRDLESGSPHSDGTWQARCQSVESRQVQLQELRQMLDDVRETTPEEMRQILASNLRNKEAAPLDSVVQELHDAIGRNVRLARREAVLEAYCEEQHKILQSLESSESRDYEAKESLRNEELKEAKVAAEREAMELKVSWRKDRMELHRIQCELQQANQTVTNLEEQLSEAMQNQEAQRGLLQKTRVTDIQASVWQSKLSNQAKDLERLQSRCAELDNERILVRGQNRTLEAWASEAKHVEAQNALQKKIFQERCVELQAKLDQQRVAYYDKNRELEVMRIHHEEEKHQLQKQIEDASRDHDSWVKEKRMLQEKVTDLEVQIAESLLSGSYHAAEHGQLRARVEDLSGDKKSQELAQQLAELQTKYQDLEGHYAAANVARSGLARQCGLLEAETARLEESLAKELRDKDDALHAHASVNAQLDHLKHSASKASNFASRLEQFEAQQQKLEEEAAKDRSRLHLEMASAEAQSQDLERLRERERLVEQLKMQYHLGHKLLGHFREVHDALAWKDLMASVDQTILALFETPKTPSGGSGGPGPGDCILAEGVTQLHRLAESAEHAAERCAGQRSEAAEAAEQQQFAHEVQLQELETQNLRLKAELAKSQSLPDSRPALTLPDDVPEEYSAIIKEVVLNGWDSVEWGGNFTLLHWAAMQNRLHLCESLLELRANPSLKDDAGMTPADYAREKGSKDVLATLQSAQLLKLNLEAKRLASEMLQQDAEDLKRDEYGELFEDYGFLKRAEESKACGNEAFNKERFEKAIVAYDEALEQLLTIAYDKSILIGKKKWNDVVVLRSTLHLNKSTCHYKLKDWQKSLDAALECLVGNHRDELMFTDPHIRQKIKESERKHGHSGATLLEFRLPRLTRAKAWFRVSQCYGHLDFLDKAKDALAKALEACDDQGLIAEISQHSLRLDTLERLQKDKQKKQFAGFWDKFQDRGGYSEEKTQSQDWDKLKYWERFKHVEDYEEQYMYVDAEREKQKQQESAKKGHAAELLHHLPPGAKWDTAVKGLTKKMYRSIDKSFEDYLEKKQNVGITEVEEEVQSSPRIEVPPEPKDRIPPRPRRKEEIPLAYSPRGARPGARSKAARSPSPVPDPRKEYDRHYKTYAAQEKAWADRASAEVLDSDEEQELQEARERMAQQRWERLNKEKKAWLEALDDDD